MKPWGTPHRSQTEEGWVLQCNVFYCSPYVSMLQMNMMERMNTLLHQNQHIWFNPNV